VQKDYEAIQVTAVRVQPDRDLQQCKELHLGYWRYNKEELSKDMDEDGEFAAHIFPLD
jgi:hypothetical protein